MTLFEDYTGIVHRVAGSIRPWLAGQNYDGKRVNTVVLCNAAKIGILNYKDGYITCVACAGRR